MSVGVNEAGHDRFAAEVNLPCPTGRQSEDFLIGAHRQESPARDCHGLRPRQALAYSPDVPVVENQLGLGSFQ
jgi:hypothetical protein